MGKKINIAEILKDKPQGIKLYDLLYNVDVELDTISTTDTETVIWCTNETDNNTTCHRGYSEFGTVRGCPDGLQILLPSKKMRDWSKFAWKKGDVLVNEDGSVHIIFEEFEDDAYTMFSGKYYYSKDGKKAYSYFRECDDVITEEFTIETEDAAQTYISAIEEKLGGKLNRETLEIEKQPEFKDGDILYITDRIVSCNFIMIYKNQEGDRIYHYATLPEDNLVIMTKRGFLSDNGGLSKRYATEEEKQQLFEVLAKEGKAWDAEKKAIVDLKTKVELKPFDKVLVRDRKTYHWEVDLFGFKTEGPNIVYHCVGGSWKFCIPYIGNESLLGTIKDAEK